LAELYLQLLEKQYIKHWISSREVSYYKRYVDDILIIYNENRITKEKILQASQKRKSYRNSIKKTVIWNSKRPQRITNASAF